MLRLDSLCLLSSPSPKCPSRPKIHASRHAHSFSFKSFQPFCRLFAPFSALASFVFNRLQPLFAKHPSGVLPLLQLPLLPQKRACSAAPPPNSSPARAKPLLKKQLRR